MRIKYSTTNEESEELDSDQVEEEVARLGGLFTGQLNDREMAILAVAEKLGLARRVYDGMPGLMGLSRIRLYERDDDDRSEP